MGRRPAWPASAPQVTLLSCEETRTPGSPREGHTQLSAPWTCSLPTSQSPSGAFGPGFPQRGFLRRWSPHTPCGTRTPCPRPRGGPGCSAQRLCDGGAFEAAPLLRPRFWGAAAIRPWVTEPLWVGVIGWAMLGNPGAQSALGASGSPSPRGPAEQPGLRRGATRGSKLLIQACSGPGRELSQVLTP